MNVSIIIVCGYYNNTDLENDRLIKFTKCLKALNKLNFQGSDNVIISEYSPVSKLDKITKDILKVPRKYVFTKSSGKFNQSITKNVGSSVSNNEILLYINSDIILESNVLDVLKDEFNKNNKIYCTCARHDVFINNSNVDSFIEEINKKENFINFNTYLNDPGWHFALKTPKTSISTIVKTFINQSFKQNITYDFTTGYIVFGDFIAITRETWKRFPFDEKILALTDVFLRDIIFGSDNSYKLSMIHDKTSCFHLGGSDYQEQEKEGSSKDVRLKEDYDVAVNKYEQCRHWCIFSFRKYFEYLVDRYYTKEQVKELIEKYRTEIQWLYFKDRDYFCEKYGVNPNYS